MRECRLAGLLVTTNRPVLEQADGHSVDGEVQVLFRPKLDPARFTSEWHRLDQPGSPPAYFREDGKQVELEDINASTADYGAELRRVVPFASALQGKIVLHGSAVRFGEWAVAFLGGSGAGKSTLADALCQQGSTRIADDLLPVRMRDDLIVVPWAESEAAADLRLGAICFLSRSGFGQSLVTTALDKKDALAGLCQNSFGELRSAKSWRIQFQALGRIADRVAAISVVLPDDIQGLPAHAEQLRRDLVRELEAPGRPL